MEDTRIRIMTAAMRAVRQYGLEGARIQNISDLAGLSPGALYRYFNSKDELMQACFTYVDRQAAAIFEGLEFDSGALLTDPLQAIRSLWQPYFRFWIARPDETIFYHRFRDSASFPSCDELRDTGYFNAFADMVRIFLTAFPALREINLDLLWLHILTSTVMYAKYVVEGKIPNNRETEDTVFRFLTTGLSGYLLPGPSCKKQEGAD